MTANNVLVIGLGAVARCTLPLLFGNLGIPPERYRVIDFAASRDDIDCVESSGASFTSERITSQNLGAVLEQHVGAGDMVIDLAWNIGTADILRWCRDHGVLYMNASVEVWDPYDGATTSPPVERTLYARQMELRQMITDWGPDRCPTAVLDHGANPGLVSHFTKAALEDIAHRCLVDLDGGRRRDAIAQALAQRSYADLSRRLGVRTIHISERDTQISDRPKQENEFVNTWSVEGFYEESIAPAELGWGTHEKQLPPGAHVHDAGPRNQICLDAMGCRSWVRSWVPCGEIIGMVIRHGEAFSISEALTVVEDGVPTYRPTVHYAYCPCDAAIASLHELHMRRYELQPVHRIMTDDIVTGRDELGCLLMGHDYKSWWIGSLLDIDETRRLAPNQNATTLQVAASVMAAARWMLANQSEGVKLPDQLPHHEILASAKPYLGPMISKAVDWTPLDNWSPLEAGPGKQRPHDEDVWQFSTFLVG